MTSIPGLSSRITSGGIPVLRVHYSADPAKRPGTVEGNRWLLEATAGYADGTNNPRWRKEYEIDYGALGGTRLFPMWERWAAAGKILIPFFHPTGYRLYGSYDHGWRNPACYHVHGVGGDKQIVTLWEFYASEVPVPQIARILQGEDVRLSDGRMFSGNPFAGQETYRVADPSMWAEDQNMSDNTMKSVAQLFQRYGVVFQRGERGGDTMVAEYLHGYYWRDPERPLYRICETCPKLIWEIGRQRHKDVSAKVGLNRDQPEALIDKDNHAWDGLKMFLQRFPVGMTTKPAQAPAGTFHWFREQARKSQHGDAIRTYRREVVA